LINKKKMVKILYDFDFDFIANSNYFSFHENTILKVDKVFVEKNIKTSELLVDLHFLGGGKDSICLLNSYNSNFFIIEPANGLVIGFTFVNYLIKFEEKRKKTIDIINFPFWSFISETIFRHNRNGDEFMVIGEIKNFLDIENNEISLKYPNSNFEWKCKYIDFVPEILRFGERMLHLYDHLLPDFKEYALYPKLKTMLLDDNILRQKYGHLMEFDNLGKSFLDYISPPFDGM